jgi:hypothetical protein
VASRRRPRHRHLRAGKLEVSQWSASSPLRATVKWDQLRRSVVYPSAAVGTQARVDYTADYYFFIAK